MEPVIGIDLGTTFSAIAFVDEHGGTQMITNDASEPLTPSVLWFKADAPNSVIVGAIAAEMAATEPENCVQFVKREMGLPANGVRLDMSGVPHPYMIWGRSLSPEEISSYVLKKLKADAEAHFGRPVSKAVITVPAYFHDPERVATETAGKLAGLHVLAILDEPMAAGLAYGIQRSPGDENVFVFDLGGGTLDVTFMRVEKQSIRMLATDGDHRLGGKDWDDCLIKHIMDEFCTANPGVDPEEADPGALGELRARAVVCKHHLSKVNDTKVVWHAGGAQATVKVTRAAFESMTAHLLDRCRQLVVRVMEDVVAGNDTIRGWNDIDKVLLVGGSTRMPAVKQMVESITGKRVVASDVNVDTCVATGAAIRAAQLLQSGPIPLPKPVADKIGNIEVTSVLSHSLGVEVIQEDQFGERKAVSRLIQKGTPVPCRESNTFALRGAGSSAVVPIMQGEEDDPALSTKIGEVILRSGSQMRAGAPIEVTFQFDSSQMLHVRVRDVEGGAVTETTVEREGILDAEQFADAMQQVKLTNVRTD